MRRLEVRLNENAYDRVAEAAKIRGLALAETVREALERYCEEVEREDRLRAVEELAALRIPVPDPKTLKREILAAYGEDYCGLPRREPPPLRRRKR